MKRCFNGLMDRGASVFSIDIKHMTTANDRHACLTKELLQMAHLVRAWLVLRPYLLAVLEAELEDSRGLQESLMGTHFFALSQRP